VFAGSRYRYRRDASRCSIRTWHRRNASYGPIGFALERSQFAAQERSGGDSRPCEVILRVTKTQIRGAAIPWLNSPDEGEHLIRLAIVPGQLKTSNLLIP